MRAKVIAIAVSIAACASFAAHAVWPERPIKFIVPYAAGGANDNSARITAQWLTVANKMNVVVENRTGANGAIAADFVSRSPADGYTLFMTASPTMVIVPHMQKVEYDTFKSFVPISIIDVGYVAIAVTPTFPAKTFSDLVAYAKARPNKLDFATGAVGSTGHLSMALLLKRAGIVMTHVPYKGSSAAALDVMAGHVPVYVGTVSDALQYHKSGKLRIIGVTSLTRSHELPDVPTISQQGYPGFTTLFWDGLLAPAGTPKEVISALTDAISAACKDAGFSAKFLANNQEPLCTTPGQFAERLQADWGMWDEAVKAANSALQ